MTCHSIIVGCMLVLACVFVAYTQAPQTDRRPLSEEQIIALLRNSNPSLSTFEHDEITSLEIRNRGVAFQLSDAFLNKIKDLGAGEVTLRTLQRIKSEQPTVERKPFTKAIKILVAKFTSSRDDAITPIILNQLGAVTDKYPNVKIVSLTTNIDPEVGREIAIREAKNHDADIVIWGWLKSGVDSVVVGSNLEVVSDLSIEILQTRSRAFLDEVRTRDKISYQLKVAKDLTLLTQISLAVIYLELEDFDSAERILTELITLGSPLEKFIKPYAPYILRATATLKKNCDFGTTSRQQIQKDVDEAIRLGLSRESAIANWLVGAAELSEDMPKAIKHAEIALRNASTDEEKTMALVLLTGAYSQEGSSSKSADYARQLKNHLITLPETPDNLIYIALANLVLDDEIRAASALDRAKNIAPPNFPRTYRIYAMLGILYNLSRSYDLALTNLKKSLELNPRCLSTYTELADVYVSKNQTDLAIATFNEAIEVNPLVPQVFVEKGKLLESRGETEAALAHFERALSLDSTNVEALSFIGKLYAQQGNSREAIKYLSRVLSLQPSDLDSLSLRAEIYLRLNEVELAISDFRELVKTAKNETKLDKLVLQSTFARIHFELINLGRYDIAREFAETYISLFPNEPSGYERKAQSQSSLGDLTGAIETQSAAIRNNGRSMENFRRRGELRAKVKDFDGALSDYDQAIAIAATEEGLFKERGKIQFEIKSYESSIKDFLKSIELLSRKNTELATLQAHLILSEAAQKFGEIQDFPARIALAKGYTEYFPQDSRGYLSLAQYYDQNSVRDLPLAIKAISRSIELAPLPSSIIKRAILLSLHGDLTSAIQDATTAIAVEPNDPAHYSVRSKFYAREKKFELAVLDLEKAINLTKDPLRRNLLRYEIDAIKREAAPSAGGGTIRETIPKPR